MPLTPGQQTYIDSLEVSFAGFRESLKLAMKADNDRLGTRLVEASGRRDVLQAAYADLAPRLGLNPALGVVLVGLERTDTASPDVVLNTTAGTTAGHVPRA